MTSLSGDLCNRSIDRIATYAEFPATIVAMEYLRLKAARK